MWWWQKFVLQSTQHASLCVMQCLPLVVKMDEWKGIISKNPKIDCSILSKWIVRLFCCYWEEAWQETWNDFNTAPCKQLKNWQEEETHGGAEKCTATYLYQQYDSSDFWVDVQQWYHDTQVHHFYAWTHLQISMNTINISLVSTYVMFCDILIYWWDGRWDVCVYQIFWIDDCRFDWVTVFISQCLWLLLSC